MNHTAEFVNDIVINKSSSKKSHSLSKNSSTSSSSSSRTKKQSNSSSSTMGSGSTGGNSASGHNDTSNNTNHNSGTNSGGSGSYSSSGGGNGGGAGGSSGGGGGGSSNNLDDNNYDSEKEKHKLYAGISSKLIKCAWEQHDRGDLEVAQDVFSKLSEDVTYKLWELANSIKTYSRHCGGYVSTDLVNNVLKDSNVPPILGATESHWDRIEYDRTYYFPADEIVDLSTEYAKELVPEDCGDIRLTTMWMSTLDNPEPLKDFANKLSNGIFNGLSDCYYYALEITENDPNVGCIVKILLTSCCEQLLNDYNSESLERCSKFINSMTYNPYTRDANIDGNLVILAQLLLCVMLGPNKQNIEKMRARKKFKTEYRLMESLKAKDYDSDTSGESCLSDPPLDLDDEIEMFEEKHEIVKNEEDILNTFKLEDTNIATDNILNIQNIYTNSDEPTRTTTIIEEQLDNGIIDQNRTLNDIEAEEIANFKNECEELFAIMEELRNTNQMAVGTDDIVNFGSSEMKDEIKTDEFNQENMEMEVTNIKKELLEGPPALTESQMDIEDVPNFEAKSVKRDSSCVEEEKYTKIFTKMCKKKMISNIATTVGLASAHWGYFEKIATLILKNRLEEYFSEEIIWTRNQYDKIVRIIYASWALGEEAVRNLFYYFDRMHSDDFGEWTRCHVVLAGTFLRGRVDELHYYWLYNICGESIFPYMVYLPNALHRLTLKHDKVKRPSTYRIKPKIILRTITKQTSSSKFNNFSEVFENAAVKKEKVKIHFKFPGCRPIISTKLKKVIKIEKVEPKCDEMLRFKSVIVIGKRKIMKTLTNTKVPIKYTHCADLIL